SVRIAHHREIADHAPGIQWLLNQNVLLAGQLGDPINFFARVALKPEMIETGFYFVLHDHQDENWIFSGLSSQTEPDIVAPLEPAVAHDRKAAERSVEINRSVNVAAIDCDVRPASRHGRLSFSRRKRAAILRQRAPIGN